MDEANVSGPFPNPPLPDFDSEGRPVPPWVKFPNLRNGSMGWRMGAGEHFLLVVFAPWFRHLSESEREIYRNAYPAPAEWQGLLDSEVPDLDSGGRLVPPWVKFPHKKRSSAAWRIKSQKHKKYLDRFSSWWETQSIAQRKEYESLYSEPQEWGGYLVTHTSTGESDPTESA